MAGGNHDTGSLVCLSDNGRSAGDDTFAGIIIFRIDLTSVCVDGDRDQRRLHSDGAGGFRSSAVFRGDRNDCSPGLVPDDIAPAVDLRYLFIGRCPDQIPVVGIVRKCLSG